MSSLTVNPAGVATANRRAQRVAEAVVSAYINEISVPQRRATTPPPAAAAAPADRERTRAQRWALGRGRGARRRSAPRPGFAGWTSAVADGCRG